MEIQDRSIVTQQTTAQKLNFFQVADVEESVFAEMLKKPEEGDVVQQSNNIEIKGAEGAKNRTPRVKVSEVRKEFPQKKIEKTEVKNQNEKDVKASLQEKKSDNSKVKNEKNDLEQPNEEKLSPETPKKEDSENETISGAMMLENTPVMEKVFNEEVLNNNGIEIADTDEAEALALVEPIVLGVSENNKEKVVLEQQSEIEDIYVKPTENSFEMIKMANSEAISGEITEGTIKDDSLLAKQAQYLDEKASFGKKLKIEVDVKEEKIAAPITKDVLKNRFEIDSIFQSVDAETQEFFETSAVKTISLTQNDQKPLQSQFNIGMASVAENVVQSEQQGIQTLEMTAEAVVSGKEGFVTTANALKNETFAKINEDSSRDAIRGMNKEVVEQIKVNITKSAIKGVDTVEIQLKPEDLGKIQIRMHITKDGKLQADIVTSRAETLDILQKEASNLAEAFNDAGYDTDSKSFNFSFQRENQFADQQQDKTGLRHFLGESIEQEVEVFENDNLSYDPVQGLNIRV